MSATERLDEIEARANAATEGPWRTYDPASEDGRTPPGQFGCVAMDAMHPTAWPADAEFIAAARSDVPALVAALRAVLEAHGTDDREWWGCDECDIEGICPTVRAIENALGGTP